MDAILMGAIVIDFSINPPVLLGLVWEKCVNVYCRYVLICVFNVVIVYVHNSILFHVPSYAVILCNLD